MNPLRRSSKGHLLTTIQASHLRSFGQAATFFSTSTRMPRSRSNCSIGSFFLPIKLTSPAHEPHFHIFIKGAPVNQSPFLMKAVSVQILHFLLIQRHSHLDNSSQLSVSCRHRTSLGLPTAPLRWRVHTRTRALMLCFASLVQQIY